MYEEQEVPDSFTVFGIQGSDTDSSDEISDDDDDGEVEHFTVLNIQEIKPKINVMNPDYPPFPTVKVHILPSKYHVPIRIIAFIDTGAQRSMMNPAILPSQYWVNETHRFKAANGEVFKTTLVTKSKIGIKFFPNCVTWTKVIGSELPDKDILIGMDIIVQSQRLSIFANGLKHKRDFKPFCSIPKLFSLAEAPAGYEEIQEKLLKLCADSHDLFKHPSPLWKKEEFFVQLPFKLNEDINPTKATHPGMTPS